MTQQQNQNRADKCIEVFARGAQVAIQIAISVSLLINIAGLMATLSAMPRSAAPGTWQSVVNLYPSQPNPAVGFYFIAIAFFVLGIIASVISQCLVFATYSNLLKSTDAVEPDAETDILKRENVFKTLARSSFVLTIFSYVFFLLGGFIFLCLVIHRII